MRLGIDFDNTFADFGAILRTFTLEQTGLDLRALRAANPAAVDIEALIHAQIGKPRFDALIEQLLTTDYTLQMAPLPCAIEVAQRLAATHELIVVTARSVPETEGVHRWLARHRVAVSEVIPTAYAPKAPVAVIQGLMVHLDDNVEVLTAFDEAHPTVPALLAHPMNLGATRAAHWRPVEDWLAFEALVKTLEQK